MFVHIGKNRCFAKKIDIECDQNSPNGSRAPKQIGIGVSSAAIL